ncbi:MAG: helix-turn-helix domain-containing protein [Nocardioides sp.]|nr:helix-turn-helix domain-containing protein [Nocardioides sp.]
MAPTTHLDHDACYRAVQSRDRRFDGAFYTAVRTTGIYCRPSCPARTPARDNVTFHATAASAQAAGFRACKRCLPDATPGSPEWDAAADAAGRAMRLVADGVVDREGVEGLASRMGYSSRHLNRLLVGELGASPLALARARRAQTARVLVEATSLPMTEIAYAAGFASIRQFNQTLREVYDASPSDLRGRRRTSAAVGRVPMRLGVRTPYDGRALMGFLAVRAVPGVEVVRDGAYLRTLRLPHGHGVVELRVPHEPTAGATAFAEAVFRLTDLRDLGAAVERTRRLLDADCDPVAVAQALADDDVTGPLVRAAPGLRVPGHVDGEEVAVRAVLGQQVSVARARDHAAWFVQQWGERVETDVPGLTHLFPAPAVLAHQDGDAMRMPRARGRALVGLCAALAAGDVALDRSADRDLVRHALLDLPGIGPWTADYIALRALGHPDVLLPTDAGTRQALVRLGRPPADVEERGEAWRPWRSYAQMHLWHSLTRDTGPDQEET